MAAAQPSIARHFPPERRTRRKPSLLRSAWQRRQHRDLARRKAPAVVVARALLPGPLVTGADNTFAAPRCPLDEATLVVREGTAPLTALKNPSYHFKRIGLEAGPLSQWLFSALAEAELAVVCVETRHMQAVLKAQMNKTDRNDARGIAQMMRVGLYRPVHVKTLRGQKLRMMLTHRKLLQSKAIAIENDLRGTLPTSVSRSASPGKTKFEARIKELVENPPDLAELVEPMLVVRRTLREQIVILHRRLLAIVRDDEVCRRPPVSVQWWR